MRTPVLIAAILLTSHVARADKPTVDEVKAAVTAWSDTFGNTDKDTAPLMKMLTPLIAAPLWYDGVVADDSCAKGWKKKGTVDAAHLAAFLPCFATAAPLVTGYEGGWDALDVKHVPKELRKHKTKLKKLAKDHTIAVFGWASAGPPAGYDVFAAKKDGDHVVIDAVVHVEYDQSGGM